MLCRKEHFRPQSLRFFSSSGRKVGRIELGTRMLQEETRGAFHYAKLTGQRLSPLQRFKHSLYQSAVRSLPQAQSRMGSIRRCNSVPALTLLSGSTPPEKNTLSLCGGERVRDQWEYPRKMERHFPIKLGQPMETALVISNSSSGFPN